MKILKVINWIFKITQSIVFFILGVNLIKFLVLFSDIPTWLSYIMYFGGGMLMYKPINYILSEKLDE